MSGSTCKRCKGSGWVKMGGRKVRCPGDSGAGLSKSNFLSRLFGGASVGSQTTNESDNRSVGASETSYELISDMHTRFIELQTNGRSSVSSIETQEECGDRERAFVLADLFDEDPSRNKRKANGSLTYGERMRKTALLNERDAQNPVSFNPETEVLIWRVECPCCSCGPIGMFAWGNEIAETHYAENPLDKEDGVERSRIVHGARNYFRGTMKDMPALGEVPEFVDFVKERTMETNGDAIVVSGVRNPDTEKTKEWFPDPVGVHAMGFEWVAYAVPKNALVEGGKHETVFDRGESRRMGMLPIFEGEEAGGEQLRKLRSRGDAFLRETLRQRRRTRGNRNRVIPSEEDIARLVPNRHEL